jgi:hypothetical protein
MITEEEKQEIIDKAVEKAMLILPETVGHLIANHFAMSKLNTEFYKKYPEFSGKKDIVASVIEMVEGKNPLMRYEDLLTKAVPEIRERIRTVGKLNTNSISLEPNRDFNGVL